MKDLICKILRIPKIIIGKDIYFSIQYKCKRIILGNRHAAWCVCPDHLDQNSIVLSFGAGTDISFDIELIRRYGLGVHCFDPTPKSIEWIRRQQVPESFRFHPIGIADRTGTERFYLPANEQHISASMVKSSIQSDQYFEAEVMTLKGICSMLQVDHIDILKMDIEGSEYSVIDNIPTSGISISQILIEFHHRLSEFGIRRTKESVNKLNQAGYKIFSVSPNGEEYSFIKP